MNISPDPIPTIPMHGPVRHFLGLLARDLFYLPRWHKGILLAAIMSMGIGWTHWGYHALADTSPAVATQPTTGQFADVSTPQPTLFAAWARRVGGSVLTGFLIGWAFRTFVRTMTSITAIFVATLGLLSYFNIMNADLTAVEKKSTDATMWVTDQAGRLRDSAMAHVHSTVGGGLGIFIGLRKKSSIPIIPV